MAPDWTADWLHRECVFILDRWAKDTGAASCAELAPEAQAGLRERLQSTMRRNTYDPQTDQITVDPGQAEAIGVLTAYYGDIFSNGRDAYAIPRGAIKDPECWGSV